MMEAGTRNLIQMLVVATLSLVLCINTVGALHCYQCDSKTNPDCKEYFDHAHVDQLAVKPTECGVDAADYCVKTSGAWGGVVGTQRFCSSRDMGNQCQFITYTDHDRVYRACIYTCKGDGCNTASSRSLSKTLTVIIAMVTSFILYTKL